MNIQLISTGHVKISQNFRVGTGKGVLRMVNALSDRRFSDWLPIYCTVIEHPEGLIVIDTGISANANDPIYFPPHIRILQAAAPFEISEAEEIGPQMQARDLDPHDVRWVISTHLHQDHDGGMRYFPNAEFLIARKEWAAAQGMGGRMNGYMPWHWANLKPRLVDFESGAYYGFPSSETVTRAGDIRLVPTTGHSKGHLAVIIEQGDRAIMVAGDSAYTQDLLTNDVIDGIGPDPQAEHETHRRILDFAARVPTIFLPTHDPDSADRLQNGVTIPVERAAQVFA